MVKAKTLLAGVSALLLLCSCSKYQFVTIRSNLHSQAKGIVIETDSVKITYGFQGQNCPVQIEVSNKLTIPIYVDWSKSALIFSGKRFSYWEDVTSIQATTTTRGNYLSGSTGPNTFNTSGSLYRNEAISFLPPKSAVTVRPLTVKSGFFDIPQGLQGQRISRKEGETTLFGKLYAFNEENSPMKFRSYLTMSTGENFSPSFCFDNEFWVSEIISTRATSFEMTSSGAQFTLKESTDFAKVMTILIGIPLLVILVMPSAHR